MATYRITIREHEQLHWVEGLKSRTPATEHEYIYVSSAPESAERRGIPEAWATLKYPEGAIFATCRAAVRDALDSLYGTHPKIMRGDFFEVKMPDGVIHIFRCWGKGVEPWGWEQDIDEFKELA